MDFFGYGSSHPNNWRSYLYGNTRLIFVVMLILIAAAVYWITQLPMKMTVYSQDPVESAWIACTTFVQDKTGIPTSDAPAYDPAAVTAQGENLYLVAVTYPSGAAYQCTLEAGGRNVWLLRKLQEK